MRFSRRLGLPTHFSLGRDMNLIVLSLVVANIGTQVEQRFFTLYVHELGGSPAQIGLVASAAGLFTTLASPLGGWATDRFRRVTLYALAPLIGALGELLMVLAPTWAWVIPGYIVSMCPGLLVGPALFGLVSDLGPEETRGRRFAYQAAAFGVCALVGPLVGGFVYQYLGYRAFMVGQAGMLCLASLLRFRVRDPRETARRESGYRAPSFWKSLRVAVGYMAGSREFVVFLVGGLLVTLGGVVAGGYFSLFMSEVAHVAEASMGVVYGLAGGAAILASVASGVASDRYGRRPVLLVTIFGTAFTLGWFALARSLPVLAIVWLLMGLNQGAMSPVVDAYFADLTDPETRGTVRSVFNGLLNLTMLPGPLVGGLLWENVSPQAPFWVAVGLTLAGALVFTVLGRPPVPRAATGRLVDP